MKYFVCAIAILASFGLATADNNEPDLMPGTPIGPNGSYLNQTQVNTVVTPFDCTGLFGSFCNGCIELVTCAGDAEPFDQQTCGALTNYKNPFCANNGCSDVPDPTEMSCGNTGFICTRAGIMPDPNCTRYHQCGDAVEPLMSYDCRPNYVFSTRDLLCRRRIQASDCHNLDCSSVNNNFIVHRGNATFYAFCRVQSGVRSTLVMRCEEPQNYYFNTGVKGCRFRCPREGMFADASDCSAYYDCYVDGKTLVYERMQCSVGMIFNPLTQLCMVGECTAPGGAATTEATLTT